MECNPSNSCGKKKHLQKHQHVLLQFPEWCMSRFLPSFGRTFLRGGLSAKDTQSLAAQIRGDFWSSKPLVIGEIKWCKGKYSTIFVWMLCFYSGTSNKKLNMGSLSISICRYLFGSWIGYWYFFQNFHQAMISIVINLRCFRWRYLKSWPSCLSIPMNGEVVEIPATSCGKPTWCNSDALCRNPGSWALAHWWLQFRFVINGTWWYVWTPFEASLGGCSGLSLRFAHASVGPWTW